MAVYVVQTLILGRFFVYVGGLVENATSAAFVLYHNAKRRPQSEIYDVLSDS